MTLLDPDEPPPVILERAQSRSPFVFVADHAGRRLPRRLGDLGLSPAELERHIAYDIGILPVAQALARAFDAPLVAQIYSRLVVDCNRPTHVAQSIPETSELTRIPATSGCPPRRAWPGSRPCSGPITPPSRRCWRAARRLAAGPC